jgi:hypothetical protein
VADTVRIQLVTDEVSAGVLGEERFDVVGSGVALVVVGFDADTRAVAELDSDAVGDRTWSCTGCWISCQR